MRTGHYQILAESLDADDVGRMLEQLHRQLTRDFGRAPAGSLRVAVYGSKERFHAALAADGQPRVDAGGYYSPETKKAYLWVQPSDYFTRQLILHECTHQFHFLVAANNRRPRADWFTEGLAEYYGMHDWDGTTLHVGVSPVMTLEDYPATAREHFEQRFKGDVAALAATREGGCDRPEAWALVHFLEHNHAEPFRALSAKLNAGADPAEAWGQVFGPKSAHPLDAAAVNRAFADWLVTIRQPWKIAFVSWQQRGDRFEGKSKTTGVALLKETPASLTAEVEPADRTAMPGLVFNYHSGEEYSALQVLPNGQARVVQRRDGRWLPAVVLKVRAKPGANMLAVRRAGKDWSLSVNGVEVKTVPADGQIGLYIQEGRAMFRVIGPGPTTLPDGTGVAAKAPKPARTETRPSR